MPKLLITGANRGLGLNLARAYAADGWDILACCRQPDKANALADLAAGAKGRVTLHAVDVADLGSIEALARELKGEAVDVLLNNAGIMDGPAGWMGEFQQTDYDDWDRVFAVNVRGLMKMNECFVGHVDAGRQKKIIAMSSLLGSIASNAVGQRYAYRASKAAVNAIMKSLSIDLKDRGITVVPLHPGWVKTDMGGAAAPVEIDASIAGLKTVIDGLTLADTGRFLSFDGTELPW